MNENEIVDIKWDVPLPENVYLPNGRFDRDVLNDSIPFFDCELSYELTKYRPIDETRGLDFNPEWFNEAGRMFDSQKKFNNFLPTSRACRDFWKEQLIRCEDGYEVNGYRLTGDNYFFINFYTMLDTDMDKAGRAREDIRPKFFAKQYEFFHYIEMCEYLGKDVISFKARGVGFSEIVASLAVRLYTTARGSFSIVSAHTEGLMAKTVKKMWKQLDWLNQNTQTGMKRVRGKIDQEYWKRASMVKSGSSADEFGPMSEIQGVTADKANKLRGDRVSRLIFEEAGSDPILKEKYTQSEALVAFAGVRIGTRVVIGTGGDKGPYLKGLQDMYLNPRAYSGLPYKHNYTETGETVYTGFFIPAHCFRFDTVDHRGVCDRVLAKAKYEKQRAAYGDDIQGLRIHKAEFCFYAEEALILQGQNDFNQAGLAQQAAEIKIHKTVKRPKRGMFFPVYGAGKTSMRNLQGVTFQENPDGFVEIGEMPILDVDKKAMRNLYVAGIDSIDHGSEDSVVGENGSKFAIVVKKRAFGNSGNYYVAKYMDRPKDVRTAYAQGLMMMWFYNCKGNLEDTKISFRAWLRNIGLDKRFLMRRPNYALDHQPGMRKRTQTLWGTPGSEKMIRHGLNLVKEFTYDASHTIVFLDVIEQLLKYSYEAKTDFDLVAAMGLCEIADEDMYNLRPVDESATKKKIWQDVGYYTDSNGVRRYGTVPSKQTMTVRFNTNFANAHGLEDRPANNFIPDDIENDYEIVDIES